MTQLIEITQLVIILIASIVSIGFVIWVIYKVLSNK